MNMSVEENDDRCQHSQGCSRSFFTYCPHCHLFLCMTHLNEHHNRMKTEWSQIFDDIKQQKTIVEQQIRKLNEQKSHFNELFQRETENLAKNLSLITNLCQIQTNDQDQQQPLTNGYEKRIEQLKTIKKLEIPRAETLIRQFDEFLERISFEPEQEISSTLDAVPIVDDESPIEDGNDSTNDFQFDNQQNDEFERENSSVQSDFSCSCPLTQLNAFGLTKEHGVPGMPCNVRDKSPTWLSSRCFHHLSTFHHLKPKVARKIVEFLSSGKNSSVDIKSVDLFSEWPMKEVVSQSIGLYVRLCPLTIEKIYGLNAGEHFTLCQPRTPVHLEQHFRTVHHFKQEYCKRFIKALIDGVPFTKQIFEPDENLIERNSSTKTRRKKRSIRFSKNSR